MARKGSIFGGGSAFGSAPRGRSTAFSKEEDRPVPRKTDLENALCDAIGKRVRVKLRYDDDSAERLFDPYAVYWSSKRKVCVTGMQVRNPEKPQDELEPRNFEVGKLRSVAPTDQKFIPDPRFDRNDKKYANGLVCSV